jgi:hypothetical protein
MITAINGLGEARGQFFDDLLVGNNILINRINQSSEQSVNTVNVYAKIKHADERILATKSIMDDYIVPYRCCHVFHRVHIKMFVGLC